MRTIRPEDQQRWREIFRQVDELNKKHPPKYSAPTLKIYNQPGLEQELDEILEENSDSKVIPFNSRRKKNQH